MRRNSNMNRVRGKRRHATSMLEFVIVLPMFLVLILFIVDMSRLLMVHSAMQEATYRAARAGAVYGGSRTPDGARVSQRAFDKAVGETPGSSSAENVQFLPGSGQVCRASGLDLYVEIGARYRVDLITPGLGGLLNVMSGPDQHNNILDADSFTMDTFSVARCEVAT